MFVCVRERETRDETQRHTDTPACVLCTDFLSVSRLLSSLLALSLLLLLMVSSPPKGHLEISFLRTGVEEAMGDEEGGNGGDEGGE